MLPRSLRHRLKAALGALSVDIPRGPLQGLRWSATSGSRFVRGVHEPSTAEAIAAVVAPGQVVYDVGAHVGYFTAVASLEVGPDGMVVAFEPRPLNLRMLRWHVQWNRLANVRIIEAAVGEAEGEGRFDTETGTGKGSLSEEGRLPVRIVALDELVRSGELPPPAVIKIDVEGGEMGVLSGAREVLEEYRPMIILATHSAELHQTCIRTLEELSYEWRILEEGADGSDHEILALPGPREERAPGRSEAKGAF